MEQSFCLSSSPDKQKFNSLRSLRSLLYLFLRVLRVLRGQTVCHHEEHEGHEVWITVRAKNARVTKIVLRSLRSLWLNFLSVPSWRSLRRRSGHALRLCSSLRGIPTRPRLSCSPEALFHRASQFFLDSIIRNSTEQFKRDRFISETGRRNCETFLYLNTSNYSPIGQICSSFRVNGEHCLYVTG
jgi:hypothetical protein